MTKRLARLEGAFSLMRASIDPGWVAVALLKAVLLGGFAWLWDELHRIEAKVDAVSLKLAGTPGTLQGALQTQTERLTALIGIQRQGGAAAPGGLVAPSRGAAQALSQAHSLNLSRTAGNLPGTAAGGSSSSAVLHRGSQ